MNENDTLKRTHIILWMIVIPHGLKKREQAESLIIRLSITRSDTNDLMNEYSVPIID